MAPIIGITSGSVTNDSPLPFTHISSAYIQAVISAGGSPLVIPAETPLDHISSLLARIDGLLLTGGGDIDPRLFNGEEHARVYGIEPERDALEIQLVQTAVHNGLPFLGICRGHQVVNVALGGSLITDIASQAPQAQRHDWFPGVERDYLAHTVALQSDCRLSKILGSVEIRVNSLHHQSILQPASSLNVVAHAPDGIIEAIELPGHPFGLGVQWHPEWLQNHLCMRNLFKALISAAEK